MRFPKLDPRTGSFLFPVEKVDVARKKNKKQGKLSRKGAGESEVRPKRVYRIEKKGS